jgi:Mn-dependent DtxR family transcriptional regulator
VFTLLKTDERLDLYQLGDAVEDVRCSLRECHNMLDYFIENIPKFDQERVKSMFWMISHFVSIELERLDQIEYSLRNQQRS